MISLSFLSNQQIIDHLTQQTTFDNFQLHSLCLNLPYQLTIDGQHPTEIGYQYLPWQQVRQSLVSFLANFSQIKQAKFHFLLSEKSRDKVLLTLPEPSRPTIISFGFSLVYDGQIFRLITATNYSQFTLDKSAEKAYDQSIEKFLHLFKLDYHKE